MTGDVFKVLSDHRDEIRSRGVRSLSVFGSRARGDAREDSDVDLLVELEEKTFDRYMDVKEYLELLFGCRIDLVLADSVKPRIRQAILAEAVRAPGL